MNYIRKFKRNSKALSPVVASIILIAVTVAVSVVVAAWMGGMTIGLMGNAEQVSVSNPVFTASAVTIQVRNTGGASVTLSSATIDGATATLTAVPTASPITIAKGTTGTINIALASGTFAAGAQYQLGLVTAKGTSIVYTATYNP